MINTIKCVQCGKEVDLSCRFCPQCGQRVYIDLSKKNLTGEMFLDVLNFVYNLIITPDIQDRDAYYHPVSRMLINKRYELEYEDSTRIHLFAFPPGLGFSARMWAMAGFFRPRASNAVTGYAIRVAEELIVKKKTTPLSPKEVENAINSFLSEFAGEDIVKVIYTHMSNKTEEKRILFVFYIQTDNKHMNYFLDEPMLQRWFDTILQRNTELTLEMCRDAFSKVAKTNSDIESFITCNKDMISRGVLDDMVFGYCVRLSESLFPIVE
jgi:hypothetical protein